MDPPKEEPKHAHHAVTVERELAAADEAELQAFGDATVRTPGVAARRAP